MPTVAMVRVDADPLVLRAYRRSSGMFMAGIVIQRVSSATWPAWIADAAGDGVGVGRSPRPTRA